VIYSHQAANNKLTNR